MDREGSPFRLIRGNRDVVAGLEHALDMARRGSLVGVVIVGIAEVDGEAASGFHVAHKDGLRFAWARFVAALTDAQQDITRNGLGS